MFIPRRQSLKTVGIALAAAGTVGAAPAGDASSPTGTHKLDELMQRLAALPRRRDFKSVPMILDNRDQWDAEALDAVLQYAGGPKQAWDNTDLAGPWLNVMRNSMNTQIWGFKHPDFLCVSATHGPAHLALFDDAVWEKYGLAKLAAGSTSTKNSLVAAITGGPEPKNTFVAVPDGLDPDPKDFQNPTGFYSPHANSIQALQRRGAVFLACHNAIWELGRRLITADSNPDKLTVDVLCADLSNHLIPGIVLTPGAVGTVAELAGAGFSYAR